jgi:hypothetical protein
VRELALGEIDPWPFSLDATPALNGVEMEMALCGTWLPDTPCFFTLRTSQRTSSCKSTNHRQLGRQFHQEPDRPRADAMARPNARVRLFSHVKTSPNQAPHSLPADRQSAEKQQDRAAAYNTEPSRGDTRAPRRSRLAQRAQTRYIDGFKGGCTPPEANPPGLPGTARPYLESYDHENLMWSK